MNASTDTPPSRTMPLPDSNTPPPGGNGSSAGSNGQPLSDAELLARELADVQRLELEARVNLRAEKPDREMIRVRRQAATETVTPGGAPEGSLEVISPIAAEARVEFHQDGMQLRQWQLLKRGGIPWQLAVDLHGVTRHEALQAVDRLIRQAQDEQVNCLRIVHGKGHGSDGITIKAELNHWLRRHEQVLAFCSATPADGGAGALYVLLRRRRN